MKRRSKGVGAIWAIGLLSIWLAGTVAYGDNQVVLVENTDIGRLHYPVYITEGKGFRVRCLSQADEDAVLVGLGIISPPSEVLDPFSEIITASNSTSQPLLCPDSDQYAIKLFMHNAGEGDRYYLQFPTDFNSASYVNSLYVPGCIGLLDALQLDLNSAINADPTPFFGENIFQLECISGDPINVVATTFTEWCTKADLNADQRKTVLAILSLTPQGATALGEFVPVSRSE